jgi:hypothetical protein
MTPKCQNIIENFQSALSSARVCDYKFNVRIDSNDDLIISPSFKVSVSPFFDNFSEPPNRRHSNNDHFFSIASHSYNFISRDILDNIVDYYWSNPKGYWSNPGSIPTYGCDKDVVKKGRSFTGKRNVDSFITYFRERVDAETKELRTEAINRTSIQMDAMILDPQFAIKRDETVVHHAQAEIRKVLSIYKHLGDDVLRTAISSFVIGSVMDE